MGIYYNLSAFKSTNKKLYNEDFAMESLDMNRKLSEFAPIAYNEPMVTAALGFIIANPKCRIGYNYDCCDNGNYRSARGNYSDTDEIIKYVQIFNENKDKHIYILNVDSKEYVDYDKYVQVHADCLTRAYSPLTFLCNQDTFYNERLNSAYPDWYRAALKIVFDEKDIPDSYSDITEQLY